MLSAVSWDKIGILGGFPGFVCILVNSYSYMWVCVKNNVTKIGTKYSVDWKLVAISTSILEIIGNFAYGTQAR